MNCWTCPVTLSEQPGSRTCWLTVLNPLRISSQSCLTRSEECRSSLRLRRNDGVQTFPTFSPPSRLPSTTLVFYLRSSSASVEGHKMSELLLIVVVSVFVFCVYRDGSGLLSSAEMSNSPCGSSLLSPIVSCPAVTLLFSS